MDPSRRNVEVGGVPHPLSSQFLPDINLGKFLRLLWRRKSLLIGIPIVFLVVASFLIGRLTPLYTTTAKVLISPQQSQPVDMQAVLTGLPLDQEAIRSEIEVILSRSLSQRVIEELELFRLPEFNPALREESWFKANTDIRKWVPEGWHAALLGKATERPIEEQASMNRSRVISTYLSKISVDRVDRSRVIQISVTSRDRTLAQKIANTLANRYIVEQLEAKFEATKNATVWLNERLIGLREKVEESDRAAEEFRVSSGLTEARGSTLISQQISELSSQLIIARAQRSEADARLGQVRGLLNDSERISSLGRVLSSPLIVGLREQEAQVLRSGAELSEEFGDQHPRIININSELKNIRTKIRDEVDRIIQDLSNDVEVARARERSLQASVAELDRKLGGLNKSDVQLRALEREAEADRNLYENFLSRFKELTAQSDVQSADARVISYADLPTGASFPKSIQLKAFVLLCSGLLAFGIVIIIEVMDRGYRSGEEVEKDIGVAGIGLIPNVSRSGGNPEDVILSKPFSSFSESLRSLWVSIQLSNVDRPPKSVLITSSVSGEGKTTASVSLARAVAKSGKKVVLIDCDLRRATVHKKMNFDKTPGLVEVLSNEISLEEALRSDASGALVLTAGKGTASPMDLLSSKNFRELVESLARNVDLVVLDSPPVTAVSDTRILAGIGDKTVFIVRWASTKREVVRSAIKSLQEAGASVAGAVLSQVNVRKHASYGYGDSGYYYGKERKYYTD